MFRDLLHHAGATNEHHHRVIEGISSSGLKSFGKRLAGIVDVKNEMALFEGSATHSAILEPERWDIDNVATSYDQVLARARALNNANIVRQTPWCADLIRNGIAEQSYSATHEETGVRVKVRADLLVHWPMGWVDCYDFKSSACKTQESFMKQIAKYGYDLSAALYLDVMECLSFTLIVVSKPTGEIWKVPLTKEMLAEGRAKYTDLLHLYAAEQQDHERELDDLAAGADNHTSYPNG